MTKRTDSPAHASGSVQEARDYFERAAAKAAGVGVNVVWDDEHFTRVLRPSATNAAVVLLNGRGLGAARAVDHAKRREAGAAAIGQVEAALQKLIDAAGSRDDSVIDARAQGQLSALVDEFLTFKEMWPAATPSVRPERRGHKSIDDAHDARVALVREFIAVVVGEHAKAAQAALAEIALDLAYPCRRPAAFEARKDNWKRRLREGGIRSRSPRPHVPE